MQTSEKSGSAIARPTESKLFTKTRTSSSSTFTQGFIDRSHTEPGRSIPGRKGTDMMNFRPWYKESEIEALLTYANKMAKGNELVNVEVLSNVYGDAVMRVQYKTASENQRKWGLFTLHTTAKRIDKMPKKYQPEFI